MFKTCIARRCSTIGTIAHIAFRRRVARDGRLRPPPQLTWLRTRVLPESLRRHNWLVGEHADAETLRSLEAEAGGAKQGGPYRSLCRTGVTVGAAAGAARHAKYPGRLAAPRTKWSRPEWQQMIT